MELWRSPEDHQNCNVIQCTKVSNDVITTKQQTHQAENPKHDNVNSVMEQFNDVTVETIKSRRPNLIISVSGPKPSADVIKDGTQLNDVTTKRKHSNLIIGKQSIDVITGKLQYNDVISKKKQPNDVITGTKQSCDVITREKQYNDVIEVSQNSTNNIMDQSAAVISNATNSNGDSNDVIQQQPDDVIKLTRNCNLSRECVRELFDTSRRTKGISSVHFPTSSIPNNSEEINCKPEVLENAQSENRRLQEANQILLGKIKGFEYLTVVLLETKKENSDLRDQVKDLVKVIEDLQKLKSNSQEPQICLDKAADVDYQFIESKYKEEVTRLKEELRNMKTHMADLKQNEETRQEDTDRILLECKHHRQQTEIAKDEAIAELHLEQRRRRQLEDELHYNLSGSDFRRYSFENSELGRCDLGTSRHTSSQGKSLHGWQYQPEHVGNVVKEGKAVDEAQLELECLRNKLKKSAEDEKHLEEQVFFLRWELQKKQRSLQTAYEEIATLKTNLNRATSQLTAFDQVIIDNGIRSLKQTMSTSNYRNNSANGTVVSEARRVWRCLTCTFDNIARTNECKMCGSKHIHISN